MEDRTKLALTAIRKILRASELNSKELMLETGLTPSQLIFMQVLDGQGEQTAGYVAAHMGITQATATALLKKLEAIGMIHRRRGERDRRQALLSITDHGQKILAKAPNAVHAEFQKHFSRLKDWEQMTLVASLERVADMLDPDHDDPAAVFDHMVHLSGEP
ncbi:winged helix-turn-helix transcriptional regulator [Rhizobium sp. CG4]|jgi:DNA-binding MarR family transcriptional regulator|uniref:MarR family winged helix-turn-helix transcriptional regulator n=1 Tax=Rhizobium/Agrobacterium group TaxID=227290 RepID=UPI001786808B|nr:MULTISPECIES: MarR family winged helix-turn-helix transcriptional regulator [Rhizobium/Agrobacterium group]MBD9389152.1 winged helix-turn-helix transcriptional regulator [Agrobacterium sp. AGB01]MCM2457456.1 winged helix-turn-helix transcriptional regulator [Rhizobium sp. CG4]MCS4244952.1 DNA-binding MarR family transcriptional regulator [Rhizobium sp. BIGb0125]